jgi:hypothetical protein
LTTKFFQRHFIYIFLLNSYNYFRSANWSSNKTSCYRIRRTVPPQFKLNIIVLLIIQHVTLGPIEQVQVWNSFGNLKYKYLFSFRTTGARWPADFQDTRSSITSENCSEGWIRITQICIRCCQWSSPNRTVEFYWRPILRKIGMHIVKHILCIILLLMNFFKFIFK